MARKKKTLQQPFPFFFLPYDLRFLILSHILLLEGPKHNGSRDCSNGAGVVDLHPQNYRRARDRLSLFLTSRRMHAEASHVFYSQHAFRIFPTHPAFYADTTMPLLGRLPRRYRRMMTTLSLTLGPGWTKPVKCWRLGKWLGLEQMDKVKTLRIYLEIDPSLDLFRGFRGFGSGKDGYSECCSRWLEGIIARLPEVQAIVFDGRPSAMDGGGSLLRTLTVRAISLGKDVYRADGVDS